MPLMMSNLTLWRSVRLVYTRRGAWLWLRHHRRKGTPMQEQRDEIQRLIDGSFS